MYEDECEDVFGFDPSDNSNYYKWYFIEKNHLTVIIESDYGFKELSFIDTPVPHQVIVNGLKWYEGRQYNYTNNYGTALSYVPKGNVHVDIYFKTNDKSRPFASFTADKTLTNIDTLINFNANASFDIDGEIVSWIWDFGDGFNSGGKKNAHSYTEPGVYGVILTVRDDDGLIDQAYSNITVIKGSNKPRINGIVPDQIKDEDEPPWILDLSGSGIDLDSSPTELRWYLTGENYQLYHVLGENSTEQKLIFSPVSNAFGNDLVTLWLIDKDGHTDTQQLWINITPVNDRPIIKSLPSLVVHYNVPYHFNLTNYIDDVETPKHLLSVNAQDQYGNRYVYVKGHEIVFLYPQDLMGETLLTTVTVSDGESPTEAIMSIKISEDWPPVLKFDLPDVVLYEGSIKLDVFNLDDYFMDPDGDDLYYSYSESHVNIYIKENNSVDISSQDDWTGEEEVMFRARDSVGAIIEDVMKVRVIPINDPPVIGDVPDIMVHFDMDYYFDLSFYISDSDNSDEELTITTSDPAHIRLSPNNHLGIILNYPKSMLGITIKVEITVSDGLLTTNKTIRVLVIPEYPPELVQPLPDIIFNEDEKLINFFDLDEYFVDYDNDSLYYTTGNVMVNITIDSNHLVSFSSTLNWFGTEQVTFRATDPIGALVEAPIHITVLPVNDPPVLNPLPKVIINESEIFELNLERFITDIDTNLTNINIIVEDPNVIVSGTSLVIFGSTDLPDVVDIYVDDGDHMVSGKLRIKVITESSPFDNLSTYIIIFIIILIIIIIAILFIFGYLHRLGRKFNIEEIFLIHNSGKLLSHMYNKAHSRFDDDIFSGMFTAIQDFIEESLTGVSFGPGARTPRSLDSTGKVKDKNKPMKLNEFKVGNNQVIVEHGKFVYMAVVYTGRGVITLHRVVKRNIRLIERKYGKHLEYWDGDMTHFMDLPPFLEKLLLNPRINKPIRTKQSSSSIPRRHHKAPIARPVKEFENQKLSKSSFAREGGKSN
jgi:PKD repeat protein